MKLNWTATPPRKPGEYVECFIGKVGVYYATIEIYEDRHSKKLKVAPSQRWKRTVLLSTYLKNVSGLEFYWFELTPP